MPFTIKCVDNKFFVMWGVRNFLFEEIYLAGTLIKPR